MYDSTMWNCRKGRNQSDTKQTCLPGVGVGKGLTEKGQEGTAGGDGNVLCHSCGGHSADVRIC